MKKVLSIVCSFVLSIGLLFGFSEATSAATKRNTPKLPTPNPMYNTKYGDSDHLPDIIKAKKGQIVKIQLLLYGVRNQKNNKAISMKRSQVGKSMYIYLTNEVGAIVTRKKLIGSDGWVSFTNMKGGKYSIHISESLPKYYIFGKLKISSYYP